MVPFLGANCGQNKVALERQKTGKQAAELDRSGKWEGGPSADINRKDGNVSLQANTKVGE